MFYEWLLLFTEEDNSDWAALPKESRPARKRPKVDMESVMVASCSDDGTIRLWNPLQVTLPRGESAGDKITLPRLWVGGAYSNYGTKYR